MTAVLEQTELSPDELARLERARFVPPPVKNGSFVKWFRDGDPSSDGYIAYVKKVGERGLRVKVINDDAPWDLNSVHHITDPELKHRKALGRNYGAWDYLPQDKENAERFAALEKTIALKEQMLNERIAALQRRIEALTNDPAQDAISQAAKRGRKQEES